MSFNWQLSEPRSPRAVVGVGDGARALISRFDEMTDAMLSGFSGTAAHELLVIFGKEDSLPWADGVGYASPSSEVAEIWLPTTQAPSLPLDLLAKSLLASHKRSPILVWPKPQWIIPLDRQTPLSRHWLQNIKERWR